MEKLNISSPKSAFTQDTQDLLEDGKIILNCEEKISDDTSSISIHEKYECKKCEQSFLNRQTLDIHKKTSIRCLRSDDDSSSESSKSCKYCNKTFASKQMRLYHESKCVTKIITELKNDYDKRILILQEEIDSLKMIIQQK